MFFLYYTIQLKPCKELYVPNLHIPITINANGWSASSTYPGFYEYTINNANIKAEPYIIEIIIRNTQDIKADIVALPVGAQSAGSIKIMTKSAPTTNLNAFLIVQKGETV